MSEKNRKTASEKAAALGKAYTILLFDADGTLLDFHAAEGRAFLAAMTACGASPEQAAAALPHYRLINDALWGENEKGRITKDGLKRERWRRLGEVCGIDETMLSRVAPLYSRLLGEQGDLLPSARRLLRALREDGRRLFLITNGLSSSQYGRIRRAGIEEFFEDVFVSEELGYSKPDLRFFTAAVSRIPRFERERTLIIGDRLTSDVALAAAAGVPCVWITEEKSAGEYEDAVLFKAPALPPLFPFFFGETEGRQEDRKKETEAKKENVS